MFEYDYFYENDIILVTLDNTNVSICKDFSYFYDYNLRKCSEAKFNTIELKYSCTKCSKDNILVNDYFGNYSYCRTNYTYDYTPKCMVKYCKECQPGNNYFCEKCISSSYSVNPLTGSCVKKEEKKVFVQWKDIYRLNLNSYKTISGRDIYGPTIMLRGITDSQINKGNSFIIYFILKIFNSRITRNLNDDTAKIKGVCEIVDEVEEEKNDMNVVDYECIGDNKENLEFSELANIELEDEESNLKNVVDGKNLSSLNDTPGYTINDANNAIIFRMDGIDGIKNVSSNKDYHFNFDLKGNISKDLGNNLEFDTKLEMIAWNKNNHSDSNITGNIIKDLGGKKEIITKLELGEDPKLESDCKFTANNTQANLHCEFNATKYKDYQTFTFKTHKIDYNGKEIEIYRLSEVMLINEGVDSD
jgi:hypothetical protein